MGRELDVVGREWDVMGSESAVMGREWDVRCCGTCRMLIVGKCQSVPSWGCRHTRSSTT